MQVLLLADHLASDALHRAVDLQIPHVTKRTASDVPLALPPVKCQDSHNSLPDSLDSFSSNEEEISAYRLQVLGPERCEMLSRVARHFVCQKGTAACISQAEQKKMAAGPLDEHSAKFTETILNGLDELIRVYSSCGEEWRMRNYELARTYLSTTFETLLQRKVTIRSCEELQSQIQRHELARTCPIGEKTWGKLREIEGAFPLPLLSSVSSLPSLSLLTFYQSGVHVQRLIPS
jgi:hypothetical protein